MANNTIDKKEIIKALLMMGFGIFVIFGVSIALGNFKDKKENDKSQRLIVSCLPDNLSYQSLKQNTNQILKLVSTHTYMFAKQGQFVNSEIVVTKSETNTSKVACGYLFVRAGSDKYGALQQYENVYINPNTFGGHINPKSAIVQNDGEKYSEYIYSLNKIEYWKDRNHKTILSADWSYLFNVSSEVKFELGLNTENKTGFIDEISIAYKCWNPQTGEENNDCRLEIKK